MNITLFNVEYLHAKFGKERNQGFYRKIREVFMVDGVILQVLNQINEIGCLKNKHPAIIKQGVNRPYKSVQIIDMGEHVGAGYHRRQTMTCLDLPGNFLTEKFVDCFNTAFFGNPHDVAGRINSENPGAVIAKSSQQHTNITADIDHQILIAQPEALHNRCRELVPVRLTGAGDGRLVRVIMAVQHLGRHHVTKLDKAAVLTDHHIKGVPGFRLLQLLTAEKSVRRGSKTQIKKSVKPVAVT